MQPLWSQVQRESCIKTYSFLLNKIQTVTKDEYNNKKEMIIKKYVFIMIFSLLILKVMMIYIKYSDI